MPFGRDTHTRAVPSNTVLDRVLGHPTGRRDWKVAAMPPIIQLLYLLLIFLLYCMQQIFKWKWHCDKRSRKEVRKRIVRCWKYSCWERISLDVVVIKTSLAVQSADEYRNYSGHCGDVWHSLPASDAVGRCCRCKVPTEDAASVSHEPLQLVVYHHHHHHRESHSAHLQPASLSFHLDRYSDISVNCNHFSHHRERERDYWPNNQIKQ